MNEGAPPLDNKTQGRKTSEPNMSSDLVSEILILVAMLTGEHVVRGGRVNLLTSSVHNDLLLYWLFLNLYWSLLNLYWSAVRQDGHAQCFPKLAGIGC